MSFKQENVMSKKRASVVGMAVAGVLLGAVPAIAQESAGRSEVSVYAGALFGDDLTKQPVSGSVPKLDDDFVAGLRYAYNFTPNFALEGSFGYNPNKVTGVVGSDVDIDVYTADFNAVWNFPGSTRLTPYVTAGVGYAFADLDRPLVGTVGNQSVSIDDDEGVTVNAGAGLKYDFTDHFLVRLDARYRFIDKLVNQADDSLNGGEVTLGLGWRF
jgi:outer membrane beta-barrel protein